MKQPSPLRFLWEILRPGRTAVAVLLIVLGYATYLATFGDYGFDEAMTMILVAQILTASTGYRERLLRGHFDAILAGRRRREPVALAHAALSLVPGLVLWLTFGVVDHFLTSRRSMPITSGGLAMFAYASLVVWAVSLWLGKNSGGVLWLASLIVVAAAGRVQLLREAYGTSGAGWLATARAVGAALAFPLVMVENGGYVETPVLVGVWIATAFVLAAGVWTVVSLDAALKEPA